jgi:hypothetical protein
VVLSAGPSAFPIENRGRQEGGLPNPFPDPSEPLPNPFRGAPAAEIRGKGYRRPGSLPEEVVVEGAAEEISRHTELAFLLHQHALLREALHFVGNALGAASYVVLDLGLAHAGVCLHVLHDREAEFLLPG